MVKNIHSPSLVRYIKCVDIRRLNFIGDTLEGSLNKNANVLDVGCGNGNISFYLGSLGYQVRGIDISEKAIEQARANNPFTNVEFDTVSAEELSAGKVRYDAIICSEVLEHLNNPKQLLDTLYLLLKDEGILIVTVPNGMGPRELLMTKPMQWMSKNNTSLWKATTAIKKVLGYSGKTVQSDADNLEHVQFFTYSDLKKLSANSKFKIQYFKHAGFIGDVFPFSFVYNRFTKLQNLDCKMADELPHHFAAGFLSAWKKDKKNN